MLNRMLHQLKCFSDTLSPEAGQTRKSTVVYSEWTVKLTGIGKCTDTMGTGILMAACEYMLCGKQSIEQVALGRSQRVIHLTAASATLLLSGSGVIQVWHMQKVTYSRIHSRRARVLEKH